MTAKQYANQEQFYAWFVIDHRKFFSMLRTYYVQFPIESFDNLKSFY